jgi:hypothetical protein
MRPIQTVAQWMDTRGVSPAELLERAALEKRVLQAIVEGRYTPSPQQRQRVAAALGVEPGAIAWGHTATVEHIHGHGPQFGRSP